MSDESRIAFKKQTADRKREIEAENYLAMRRHVTRAIDRLSGLLKR